LNEKPTAHCEDSNFKRPFVMTQTNLHTLPPLVKRRFTNPHLSTDLLSPRTQLVLLDRKGDLLFRKPARSHNMLSFPKGQNQAAIFYFYSVQFIGVGSQG
jgi:hypothetical protein